MCGIAGFAGLEDRGLLESMTRALRHRGPDDEGFFFDQEAGVGLGSRRLAIIDPQAGPQPLAGEDGSVVVVFNGEIYNFRELRSELEKKGHRFKTRTDTEVIAHLYEEEGPAAVERLSGMFAIALWDKKRRALLLARDHLGVKPLYYAAVGRRLYFGSELKAILKAPDVSRELDLESLGQYLDLLYVAAPATIYRSARKLMPGERLIWRDGEARLERFWKPAPPPAAREPRDAVERLDALMRDITREQLVADVPVGLFLSGGLDSSALAYYAAASGAKPQAFCASFPDAAADFDETEKARLVARRLGLELDELPIEPDVESALDALVEAFDEPLADSSALPTYWVSKLARASVKTALTGIGGDEVFGGYPRYAGAKLLPYYGAIPGAVRRGLARAGALVPERVSSRNVGGWARRFLAGGAGAPETAYASWMGHLTDAERGALFAAPLGEPGRARAAILEALDEARGPFLKRAQAADLRTYLPDDLLALADRTSMSVGLELRVPLCDKRLVEFALALPPASLVRGATPKALFRRLLAGKLPPEILEQKKQGFMIPLGLWFRGELKPLVEISIEGLRKRGLVRREAAERTFREHLSGRRNRSDVLWSWIMLERWLVRHAPTLRLGSAAPRATRGKKILMVTDFIFQDHEGGLGRGAWEEAKALARRGHEVRVWCLAREKGLAASETLDGLAVHRLDAADFYARPWTLPDLLRRAAASLGGVSASFSPDVVITQSPLSGWLARRQKSLSRARFVHRYNSSWEAEYAADRPGPLAWPGRLLRGRLERRLLRRVDAIAVISDFMRRDVASRFGLAATTVVPGVDFDRFKPGDKAAARKELGLDGAPLLLTVRNLRPRMGWENLFGAAERLRADHPGLKLVVVGEGPLRGELEAEVRRRGLAGAVRFAGRVPDERLPLYYRAADLFVLPSRELEGLGLVLLEALASGAPCAGTPVGGIPEVLNAIAPSWLADAATPEALADAVRRALADKRPAADLRSRAEARFGWDRLAESLEPLLAARPRLLHLVTRLDVGGSAENVVLSAKGAERDGFDAAIASGPSRALTEAARGVPVLVVPALRRELSPARDLAAFLQILGLLRRFKPDVLHTHSSKAGVLGRWAAAVSRLATGRPRLVVHTPHGHVFYGYFGTLKTAVFLWIERATALLGGSLVALSEGERRESLMLGVGRRRQWSVVPSGVAFDKGDADGAPGPRGAGAVTIGCVARLEPVKGVAVLVEAAALARARTKRPVRFVVVGDGPLREPLEARIRELGLADVFELAGYRERPIELMRAMDVYVQPSLNEGMGKALVTAQALGIPVAASRVCGIPDVVAEDQTGLLVPPEDPQALADALVRLVEDDALRLRLGEAGKSRMAAPDETGHRSFSAESMVARLNSLYRAGLLALAVCLCAAARAGAVTLKAAIHVHSSISHGGVETLEAIAEHARDAGDDVLIPTETFVAEWEYGLWPLRGLIKKRVTQNSVLTLGVENYLERLKRLRARHPELVIIPGVEAAAYYRWEGLPWKHLTINDWNRHILIVGPEEPGAYERLPALGNPKGGAFEPFLLWPLLLLALGAGGWFATRQRRYAAVALVGLVFLADGWPYRGQVASPYAAKTPWLPYQRLIEAGRDAGALVIWAHPDSTNWGKGETESSRVSAKTEPYPEALVRTSGYDGFGALWEGMRDAGRTGGTWDRSLKMFVDGERPSPSWALAELDYRDPGSKRFSEEKLVIDAASRKPADILDALKRGRFYSVQADARPLVLKTYRLVGPGGAAGSGETLKGTREPRLELELEFEKGAPAEAQIEIIRDGETVARQTVSVPGRWSFELSNTGPRCCYRVVVRSGANEVLVTNPIFAFEG